MTQHRLSFWDALIWAVAKEHNVTVIDTEDFQEGRDIDGVRHINLFQESPICSLSTGGRGGWRAKPPMEDEIPNGGRAFPRATICLPSTEVGRPSPVDERKGQWFTASKFI
jgi:hypothetical protein